MCVFKPEGYTLCIRAPTVEALAAGMTMIQLVVSVQRPANRHGFLKAISDSEAMVVVGWSDVLSANRATPGVQRNRLRETRRTLQLPLCFTCSTKRLHDAARFAAQTVYALQNLGSVVYPGP